MTEAADLIRELGQMALASRLRRLSDAMMEEMEALYRELGLPFRPRWFPLFRALERSAAVSITDLARALGLSHTAVKNIAEEMIREGLVRAAADPGDDRRRMLRLTPQGRRLGRRLEPVWREVQAAVTELMREAQADLSRDLARFEAGFRRHSIADRTRRRLGLPPRSRMEIVPYRSLYKKDFKRLNLEWLGRIFPVEPEDAQVLDDPNGQIVRRGGAIFFGLLDGRAVGTCALRRHRGGLLELCKMSVEPSARGRGIGAALVGRAVEHARARGAPALYLQTNPKLRSACWLYRRLGFRRVRDNPLPRPAYRRGGFVMVLNLAEARPPIRKEKSR